MTVSNFNKTCRQIKVKGMVINGPHLPDISCESRLLTYDHVK